MIFKRRKNAVRKRLEIVKNILDSANKEIEEETEEAKAKIRNLLSLKKGERTILREYPFQINSNDEEAVQRALENLGRERYSKREEPCIAGYLLKTWASWIMQLRWPNYIPSEYVDCITISNDGKGRIYFVRGQGEIKKRSRELDQEAQQIINDITARLS